MMISFLPTWFFCNFASTQISNKVFRVNGPGKTYLLLNGQLLSHYDTLKFAIEFHFKKLEFSSIRTIPALSSDDDLENQFGTIDDLENQFGTILD